jgi:hypothetical protein
MAIAFDDVRFGDKADMGKADILKAETKGPTLRAHHRGNDRARMHPKLVLARLVSLLGCFVPCILYLASQLRKHGGYPR